MLDWSVLAGMATVAGVFGTGGFGLYKYWEKKQQERDKNKTILHFNLEATEKYLTKGYTKPVIMKHKFFSHLGNEDAYYYSFHSLIKKYESLSHENSYILCKELSNKNIPFDKIFISIENLNDSLMKQTSKKDKYSIYKGEFYLSFLKDEESPFLEFEATNLDNQNKGKIRCYIDSKYLAKDSSIQLKEFIRNKDKSKHYGYILAKVRQSESHKNYYLEPYNKNTRFISIPSLFG